MSLTNGKASLLNQLKAEIKNVEIAMLTTVSLQGKLRSRPMFGNELDKSGKFWFSQTNFLIK
jgi:general stress protein 26